MAIEVYRIKRQLELEKEAVGVTREEYFSMVAKLKKNGHGSTTGTGRDLLYSIITPLHEAIVERISEHGRGRVSLCNRFIASLPAEYTAFITAKNLIDGALAEDNLSSRAAALGNDLVDQANAIKLQEFESGAHEALEHRLRQAPTELLKKKVKKAFFDKWYRDQIDPVELEKSERVRTGLVLLHIASSIAGKYIKTTPYKPRGKQHTTNRIQITEEFMAESKSREELRSLFSPKWPISVVPPRDWESLSGGVYYSEELRARALFVRSWDKRYLRKMHRRMGEYPQMFAAVNEAQKTAWRVNRNILGVLQEALELGGGKRFALPVIDRKELPPIAGLSPNSKAFQDAQRARGEMISRFTHLQGTVTMAEKHVEDPELYFGYALDTRGRGYPVYGGRYLSPQGDDISKSLLEFAHGEALGSPDGVDWLLYGAASVYGIDKVSRAERIVWAEEHAELMAACATDPFSSENRNFWTAADKPWSFLAFCFEVRGALQDGEAHVSHISIPQDGCQNALQHVAGMLRNKDLAIRTSVISDGSGKPRDLYQDIADRANEILSGMTGDKRSIEELLTLSREIQKQLSDKDENSKLWAGRRQEISKALLPKLLAGNIDRSMTKRPVMTCTYDVSTFTRKEQISEAIDTNIEKKGGEFCIDDELRWGASLFLEPIIHNATCDIITAAFVYLKWLKEVADVMTSKPACSRCEKCGKTVCKCECEATSEVQRKARRLQCNCRSGVRGMEWVTPLGFPVIHDKQTREIKRVNTIVGTHKVSASYAEDTGRVDRKRVRTGMAANFTHSYDATMLWYVVLQLAGIPLALIHDSFGTLPSRSSQLALELRKAYVWLYSKNRLSELLEYTANRLELHERELLPELPEMGELEVEQALESEYIFS